MANFVTIDGNRYSFADATTTDYYYVRALRLQRQALDEGSAVTLAWNSEFNGERVFTSVAISATTTISAVIARGENPDLDKLWVDVIDEGEAEFTSYLWAQKRKAEAAAEQTADETA